MIVLRDYRGKSYRLDAEARNVEDGFFEVTYPSRHKDLYDERLWSWHEVPEARDSWTVGVEYKDGNHESYDNLDYQFASSIAKGKITEGGIRRLVIEAETPNS